LTDGTDRPNPDDFIATARILAACNEALPALPVARRDQVQAAFAEGRVRFHPFTEEHHEVWIDVVVEGERLIAVRLDDGLIDDP
jgi:desulfoferrodoxin (superoxide reductase-like protein)